MRRPPIRAAIVAGLTLLLGAFGEGAAAGQITAVGGDSVFVGRVVDASSGAVVTGAAVSHLDSDGSRIQGAFSNTTGYFSLRIDPEPGHVLRIERLGYAPSEYEIPDESTPGRGPLQIAMTRRPIELEEIRVSAEAQCASEFQGGTDVGVLWDAARTGLAAALLTQQERLVRYRVRTWAQEVDGRGRSVAVLGENESAIDRVPFVTAPPDELAEEGYVREIGDSVLAYGPDALVLLSGSFRSTHCFRVAGRHPSNTGWIGLAFEPTATQAELTDVSGTLWLDVDSGELRLLEFLYVTGGAPHSGESGGRIEFEVLDDGPWVVSRWRLRLLILWGRDEPLYHETGGVILEILSGTSEALSVIPSLRAPL